MNKQIYINDIIGETMTTKQAQEIYDLARNGSDLYRIAEVESDGVVTILIDPTYLQHDYESYNVFTVDESHIVSVT